MFNQEYEEIRRKLQSRIKVFSNNIATVEYRASVHKLHKVELLSVQKEQTENKRLMAALIQLQRENRALTKLGIGMTKVLLNI